MIEYAYADSAFLNSAVAPDKLHQEIEALALTPVLEAVVLIPSGCRLLFSTPLSSGEEDLVEAAVASHDGIPETPPLGSDQPNLAAFLAQFSEA